MSLHARHSYATALTQFPSRTTTTFLLGKVDQGVIVIDRNWTGGNFPVGIFQGKLSGGKLVRWELSGSRAAICSEQYLNVTDLPKSFTLTSHRDWYICRPVWMGCILVSNKVL